MNQSINILGVVVGLLGVLISIVSGLSRLMGTYHMSGFSVSTLLNAGIAMMVFACFVKLYNKS